MAKKPDNRGRDEKLPKSNWTRTAGAFGDESMQEMADFNADGAGVVLNVKAVGSDPNADVGGKRREGAE